MLFAKLRSAIKSLRSSGGCDAGNLSRHGPDEQREPRQGLSWKFLNVVILMLLLLLFFILLLFLFLLLLLLWGIVPTFVGGIDVAVAITTDRWSW